MFGRSILGRLEPGRSDPGRLPGRVLGRSGRLDWLPPGRVTPGWFNPGREISGREVPGSDVPGRDGRVPVLGMLGRLVPGNPVLGRLVPGRFVLKLGALTFGRLKLFPPTWGMLV